MLLNLWAILGAAMLALFAAVEIVRRTTRPRPPLGPPPANFSVDVVQRGRTGDIVYREGAHTCTLGYELGGAGTLFIIFASPSEWQKLGDWAAGRRTEILYRIGSELVRQGGRAARTFQLEADTLLISE